LWGLLLWALVLVLAHALPANKALTKMAVLI
jgi:hypothetical protein